MLLTCPACDTQYKVDDGAVAPGGSRVRCFRCSYTWTAKPEKQEAAQAQTEAELTPRPAGCAQPEGAKPEGAKPEGAKPEGAPPKEPSAAKPETASKPAAKPAESAAPGVSDDDLREKLRQGAEEEAERSLWPYYLLILVLSVTLAVVVWTNRETLATAHPIATKAFSLFGYDAVLVGEGLKLDSIRSVRRQTGDQRELRVEGEVVNVSDQVRAVPALRIRLLDETGAELASWTEQLREESLQPEERALFSFSRANPPEEAADIGIDFVPLPAE